MITPQRYAYSSLYVDDLGRLNRVLTSALHVDLASAAKAAEISEPADRAIDWFGGVLDRQEWLIGLAINHNPEASAPYLAPRLVHPASATEDEIRQVWAHTRSSKTFLAEINELREERHLHQGPAPRFDTAPAPTPTYPRI